jgi:hypothetical protein
MDEIQNCDFRNFAEVGSSRDKLNSFTKKDNTFLDKFRVPGSNVLDSSGELTLEVLLGLVLLVILLQEHLALQ